MDADVIIDLLRGFLPAVAWIESVKNEQMALPGYVVLGLLDGCRSRPEMDRMLAFLRSYRVVWPTVSDCNRAIADFAAGRLQRKLGILDVLIAECAVGLNVPLYTFNVKHFSVVPGLQTVRQYPKLFSPPLPDAP